MRKKIPCRIPENPIVEKACQPSGGRPVRRIGGFDEFSPFYRRADLVITSEGIEVRCKIGGKKPAAIMEATPYEISRVTFVRKDRGKMVQDRLRRGGNWAIGFALVVPAKLYLINIFSPLFLDVEPPEISFGVYIASMLFAAAFVFATFAFSTLWQQSSVEFTLHGQKGSKLLAFLVAPDRADTVQRAFAKLSLSPTERGESTNSKNETSRRKRKRQPITAGSANAKARKQRSPRSKRVE